MINVVITHIGQSLDLKRRSFDHTVKLELPDGQVISATVDEQSVERLMKFVANDESPDQMELPTSADPFSDGQYADQPAHLFGGAGSITSPVLSEASEQMTLPVTTPVERPEPPVPYPQPSRTRTVPKDEYGYPIVRGSGVDVEALVSGGMDDDGVPTI